MFVKILLIAVTCSCSLIDSSGENSDEPILELVHVFFRHGSRTPERAETYPNDPLAADGFRPLGFGQLTNDGKRGAYQLGKILRERYASFLGDTYSPDIASVKSTDYVRTQMSALLVLAGLFPPLGSQKWNNDLSWMPVPYSYEKKSRDFELRLPFEYCPKLNRELESVLRSESAQKVLLDHEQDLSYMSQHSGKTLKTLLDAFFLYHSLHAEEKMNLTLPEWTKPIYPKTLHNLAVDILYYESSNVILKKLNGGRMFKKIMDNMNNKSKGLLKPSERKIFLFSGHEANLVSILSVLDLFDKTFPEYSSAVLIELYRHSISKQHTVKVVYIRDVYKQPDLLVINGCSEFCPLERLVDVVKQYLPNNYTEECESQILLD